MARKVLLIGWDGADWKVAGPMMDAGKMPNLLHLVERGVMGNLATLSPSLSPMLWTSIATGKRPFKHGVLGFTEPNPQGGGIRPITTLSRKTRAIWNILQLEGKTSNVVGWWPSHPAEPILGVMVSNHYQRAIAPLEKPWPVRPGTIHPERLIKPLAKLRLHPQELTPEHILPFIPRAAEINQEKDKRLVSLAKIIADCTSIHAAATALVQLEPWDFMAVYYDALDHFSHGFMRYRPPRMQNVSEKDFEIYQDVVEGGYRFHDMMLGVLLHLAGEDTTVILMSDHGFHPDHLRPSSVPHEPAGPAAQHRQHGIFVMAGEGIKQDERIYGANLMDVTPTILALYGLPVGKDMDGKVLVNAFTEPPQVDTIASWEQVQGDDGRHASDALIDPVEAQEAINQLAALGYIAKPDDDSEKAVAQTLRELRYNEARSYMDANRHTEAVAMMEKLVSDWPDEYRFTIQLVMCYQSLGRTAEARAALDSLLERRTRNATLAAEKLRVWQKEHAGIKIEDLEEKERRKLQQELLEMQREASQNPFAVECLQGIQLLAEGDPEGALVYFQNAELINDKASNVHIEKGKALLALNRPEQAEESFGRALEIDSESIAGHLGLCRSLLKRRQNRAAAEAALNAVGLLYYNPTGHFLLGVALHRMNRIPRAIEAFKVCLTQNPNYVLAHKRLAHIYEKRISNPSAADEHRRLAQEAKRRVQDLRDGIVLPGEQEISGAGMASDQDILGVGEDILTEMTTPLAETIVIVSGLPRSGTSMMMQMLEAGGLPILTDGQRRADAHNERGYYEFTPAANIQRDNSWIQQAKGKAVKVVAQLLPAIPRSEELTGRVIFMQRDLSEVVTSQRDMLTAQGKKGADLDDIRLRVVFSRQLRRIQKLLAVGQFPVLYVSHRACIKDPVEVAARVNSFLGGTLNEQAMAAAIDPNLYYHRSEVDNASRG